MRSAYTFLLFFLLLTVGCKTAPATSDEVGGGDMVNMIPVSTSTLNTSDNSDCVSAYIPCCRLPSSCFVNDVDSSPRSGNLWNEVLVSSICVHNNTMYDYDRIDPLWAYICVLVSPLMFLMGLWIGRKHS